MGQKAIKSGLKDPLLPLVKMEGSAISITGKLSVPFGGCPPINLSPNCLRTVFVAMYTSVSFIVTDVYVGKLEAVCEKIPVTAFRAMVVRSLCEECT